MLPSTERTSRPAPRLAELFAVEPVSGPSAPVPAAAPALDSASAPAPAGRSRALLSIATCLQTCGLALLTYVCLFHLSVVRGSSMAPSIHDGDRILIDPLSYMFGHVERGDIVVLKYPLDPSLDYIKRVVGLPGDEVVIEEGEVWVNGEHLDEPYVLGPDSLSSLRVRVQPAHYFVLGDNRPRSCDSREFGQVPQDYVRGKVEVRVWPPERVGRIDL